MAKYMEWLSALGNSDVSRSNPLKNTSTVNSDGTVTTGGTTPMSGYTKFVWIIDEELSIAKDFPLLDIGGLLEVSEIIQIPG